MKKVFLLILLIAGLTFRPTAAQTTPTIVRCEPSTVVVETASNFTVDLYVEDAVDLYGIDVMLSFDSNVGEIVDVNTNRPGVQIEPLPDIMTASFIYQLIDNSAESLRFAIAQAHPDPPRTGEGSFARVTIDPLASGNLDFNFLLHQLSDINGGKIDSVAHDCDIQVTLVPLAVELTTTSAVNRQTVLLPMALLGMVTLGLLWHRRLKDNWQH